MGGISRNETLRKTRAITQETLMDAIPKISQEIVTMPALEAIGPSSLPLLSPPRPKAKDRRGNSESSLMGLYARLSSGQPERRRFRERRATPRVPVELECEESSGESRYVRLTTDLSTFGMSTRHGPTPVEGSRLVLKLFLPDEPMAPLKLEAEVLGSYDQNGGMRLRFHRPSLDAVRRIHRFLVTRPA
jgi:hypothetical protein